MKKINQKMICSIVPSIVLIIGATNLSFSQTTVESKSSKFLILVETTSEGLKLSSQEGCAWKELAIALTNDNSQAIDQYGLTPLNRAKPTEDKNLANFLFIIKKTKKGISLEGKEGTAWLNLSFGCPKGKCYQYIDINGMTVKN